MARQIRYRQRELAALPAERRRALLGAEVRHLFDGAGVAEKNALLEDLERYFPLTVSSTEGPAPVEAAGPRRKASPDELLSGLGDAIRGLPQEEQAAWKTRVLNVFGEAPRPAVQGTEKLSTVLEVFRQAMLLTPDPVLNDSVRGFSARDLTNVLGLAVKLNQQADPLSKHLWSKLSRPTQELVTKLAMQRRTGSDLDQCAKALAEELRDLVENETLYDAQRFAQVKLSAESENLKGKSLGDRGLVRLNQALLEDAYPEEIRCQTPERELIEDTIRRLSEAGEPPLSAEAALHLAAVALIQLGCLEQFARLVLKRFNKNVFDPVHGRLNPPWESLGHLLARFVTEGDSGTLAARVRDFSGLLKCLLFWYEFSPAASANTLAQLEPEVFERRAKTGFGGKTDYEKAFSLFRETYRSVRRDLCGAKVGEAPNEEELKEFVKRTIERKVVTSVSDRYGWEMRG